MKISSGVFNTLSCGFITEAAVSSGVAAAAGFVYLDSLRQWRNAPCQLRRNSEYRFRLEEHYLSNANKHTLSGYRVTLFYNLFIGACFSEACLEQLLVNCTPVFLPSFTMPSVRSLLAARLPISIELCCSSVPDVTY